MDYDWEWRQDGHIRNIDYYRHKGDKTDPAYMVYLLDHGQYPELNSCLCAYLSTHSHTLLIPYISLHAYVSKNNYKVLSTPVDKSYLSMIDNKKNFKDVFKNKSIAIVGNGKSALGRKQGAEIDNHDIVVRFNNFRIHGYEDDYGSKIDIFCPANGIPCDNKIAKICLYPFDLGHTYTYKFILTKITANYAKNVTQHYIDEETLLSLKAELSSWPSSGITVAWFIKKFCQPSHVSYYGFAFQQAKQGDMNHYYNLGARNTWLHKLDLESKLFLKELI